jgi:hypothetical protein
MKMNGKRSSGRPYTRQTKKDVKRRRRRTDEIQEWTDSWRLLGKS